MKNHMAFQQEKDRFGQQKRKSYRKKSRDCHHYSKDREKASALPGYSNKASSRNHYKTCYNNKTRSYAKTNCYRNPCSNGQTNTGSHTPANSLPETSDYSKTRHYFKTDRYSETGKYTEPDSITGHYGHRSIGLSDTEFPPKHLSGRHGSHEQLLLLLENIW